MLQDYIRKRSLFAPPIEPGMNLNLQGMDLNPPVAATVGNTQEPDDYNVADIYSKIVGAQTPPAQQAYRDFLANQTPSRDDFKPAKMGRVAAMLAGISAGAEHGGGAGYKTAQDILDSPYNDAMNDWKLQGDKLAKASDLEEKDISNRVKTYRDIVGDMAAQRNNARQSKLTDAQIADINSKIDTRRSELGTKGWNYTNDAKTGHRIATKIGPDGLPQTLDLGIQGGLSIGDQIDLAGKKAGAESNATFPNQSRLAAIRGDQARQTQAARFNNIKQLIEFKTNQPKTQIESLSDGSLVIVDKTNNTVEYTGLNSGKLGDKEKAALGLANAKELKQTPTPDKTVETKIGDDGKSKTVTTKSSGSSGKIKMTDPTGKAFLVDPKEEKDAIAHGWKRIS